MKTAIDASYAKGIGIWDDEAKQLKAGNTLTSQIAAGGRRSVSINFEAVVAAALAAVAESASIALTPTALATAMAEVVADLGLNVAVITPSGVTAPTIQVVSVPAGWGSDSDSGFCLGSSFCGAGAIVVLVLLILVGLGVLVGGIVVATSMQSRPAHQERDPPQKAEQLQYEVAETGIQPSAAYDPQQSFSHEEIELQPVATTTVTTPMPPATDVQLTAEVVQVLEMYFDRYDLDRSGTLNSADELRQIGVNLAFNHPDCLRETDPGALQAICDSIGVSGDNPMSLPQFLEWFKTAMYKPPS